MISKVYKTLESLGINQSEKILCAVSGGIDSVAMLHCLHELDYYCIVAHCNFQLRGDDSDKDEQFVKDLAAKFDYKFVSEKFDTESYATKAGISIQMAARDLRFEWFYEIAEKHKCKYIALAHNSDDQVETVLFNLVRGTGIRGLCGMKNLKGNLLRPLLEISRNEIEVYAKENYIDFRTDVTNAKTEYSRNKIRHLVFPILAEINPNFRQNAFNTSQYLYDVLKIYEDYILKTKFDCVTYNNNKIYININKLKEKISYKTILFELFSIESLPNSFAVECLDLLESQSGKKCTFRNIEVLKDRDFLIINNSSDEKKIEYSINDDIEFIDRPINLSFKKSVINSKFKILKSSEYAFLDYDKLKFPLVLRKWEDGDKFKPLGMNNFKKLSDFFIDNKFSVFKKEDQWLLVSGDDIVWIVGHRIDDRYKISETSNNAYIVKLEKGI